MMDINISMNQIEDTTTRALYMKTTEMQNYMEELVSMLSAMDIVDSEMLERLHQKNELYRKDIDQIIFLDSQANNEDELTGHQLLGNHKKILVIGGQELGKNVMHGIAKDFGFSKKDLEFMDYDKAKSQFGSIRGNGKYRAIIFGACPHKTSGCAGYSSALEMSKQEYGMPFTVDARNQAGKLKVTKQSFRKALMAIYEDMRSQTLAYAV